MCYKSAWIRTRIQVVPFSSFTGRSAGLSRKYAVFPNMLHILYSLELPCILSLARVNLPKPFRTLRGSAKIRTFQEILIGNFLLHNKTHFLGGLKWLISNYALCSDKGNLGAKTSFNCESVFKKRKHFMGSFWQLRNSYTNIQYYEAFNFTSYILCKAPVFRHLVKMRGKTFCREPKNHSKNLIFSKILPLKATCRHLFLVFCFFTCALGPSTLQRWSLDTCVKTGFFF